MYDFIIKNGTLIDFETMTVSTGNVYISGGKFAAPPASESELQARHIIDATGKYVLPGLIDSHVHSDYRGGAFAIPADTVLPPCGVTASVDAGTTGAFNFEGFYHLNISGGITNHYALLNIASLGCMGTTSSNTQVEDLNPKFYDIPRIRKLFDKYPHTLKGIKIRYDWATLGTFGKEVLEKTVEVAEIVKKDGHDCVVGLHFDEMPEWTGVQDVCDILRPGDIFYHYCQPRGETIFDENGSVRECIHEARRKGILFDISMARAYWTWENIERAFAEGLFPDIITTDLCSFNVFQKPLYSLPYVMSLLSAAGMNELDLFKAVTATPAKAYGIYDTNGVIAPGRLADLCIFEAVDWDAELEDHLGKTRKAYKRFDPMMTFKDGMPLFRQVSFL